MLGRPGWDSWLSSSGEQANRWDVLDTSVPFLVFDSGVAVMKLGSPPVNSLSLELLTEFVISLEKLENDKSFRGVLLTSVGGPYHPGGPHLGLSGSSALRQVWHRPHLPTLRSLSKAACP